MLSEICPACGATIATNTDGKESCNCELPNSSLHTFLAMLWITGRISRLQWWAITWGSLACFFLCLLLQNEMLAKLLAVPLLWINVVASIRRWHDMNRSGFWNLVVVIPVLGPLYAVGKLGLQAGDPGMNDYGWLKRPHVKRG